MTDQPYTDADVSLIAGELRETGMKDAFFDDSSGSWEVEEKQHQYEAAARAVLDALATAGRLLPAGTETVEQPGIRIRRDGVVMSEEPATREQARIMIQSHEAHRAVDPGWRGSAEMIHRYQHTTPWATVEETS
ncbi:MULTISPECIES: hypothetical protein [unclassified Micromonospora]|uniref:hypothetical protein n=1 Tax=unclassified Micromonospora TaxID=2617518 RepID=UPI0034073139